MSGNYDKAKQFIEQRYGLDKRRDGEPLKSHPLRVAQMLEQDTDDDDILAAAVLHDIVSNSYATHEEIQEFGERIAELTRKVEDRKDNYWERIERDEGAKAIRIADLSDQLSEHWFWTSSRARG